MERRYYRNFLAFFDHFPLLVLKDIIKVSLDRLSTQSSTSVDFVFAILKRWSVANENAISIF